MKIRHDFVTNSSSSSFIVTINKDFIDSKVQEDFFNKSKKVFLDLILECGGIEIASNDEILETVNKIYKYNNLQSLVDEESLQMYQKYVEYLNNNFKIYFIEDVYHINIFYDILEKMKQSKSENCIIEDLGEI